MLSNNDGDGGCSFIAAPIGGPVAQVHGIGPRVGGRLALFCIHRVNRVYVRRPCSDFMDMLRRLINCRMIIIVVVIIIIIYDMIRYYDCCLA